MSDLRIFMIWFITGQIIFWSLIAMTGIEEFWNPSIGGVAVIGGFIPLEIMRRWWARRQ